MLHYGVFASRWPLDGQTVCTIVNRNEYDVSGPQMALAAQDGMRYFDLYHGVELKPVTDERPGDSLVLPSRGSWLRSNPGCRSTTRLRNSGADGEDAEDDRAAAFAFSHEWAVLPQHIVEIPPTKPPCPRLRVWLRIPDG